MPKQRQWVNVSQNLISGVFFPNDIIMTEDNIYIISLKYGVDNLNNEVTYNKLLDHLKSQNITVDKDLQRYFHVWFYEKFLC